ncbi:MAG: SMC family ATPase [Thermoplasmata archaeon]|nr:SMC family ATPase [Thermoplasmata archaeon]
MRLVSLHLENYRQFRTLDLEFPEGLIGIVGPNGSGKTTLVEAVAWTLYGNKREIVRAGKDSIKWAGAGRGDRVLSSLVFVLEGEEYTLERTMKDASLWSGKNLLAKGTRAVEDKIVELLGMEYPEFSASVYARQKELSMLSRKTPEERRRLVHRLMGITAVEEARDRARRKRRELESRLEGAMDVIYRDGVDQRDTIRKEMEEAKGRMDGVVEAMETEERRLEEIRKRLENAEGVLAELEGRRKEYNRLLREMEGVKGRLEATRREAKALAVQIGELRERGKEMPRLEKLEEEYVRARERNERLESEKEKWQKAEALGKEMDRLRAELDGMEGRMEGLKAEAARREEVEGQLADVEEKKKAVEGEIERLSVLKGEIEGRISGLRNTLGEKEEHLNQIAGLGEEGVCPTCERPLGGHYRELLAKYGREMEDIRSRMEEAEEERRDVEERMEGEKRHLAALDKKRRKLEGELKRLEGAAAELRELERRRKEIKERLETLASERDGLGEVAHDPEEHGRVKALLAELEESHRSYIMLSESLSRLPELERREGTLGEEIGRLSGRLEALEEKMSALAFSEEEYEEARRDVEALRREERGVMERLSALREDRASLSASLRSLESRLEELGEAERKIRGFREEIRYLEALAGSRSSDRAVFNDFLRFLTDRMRPLLREHASAFFNVITDDRYGGLELDEDYSVRIYDAGPEPLPVSRFSGGEEDVANLSLRLAISRVLWERSGERIQFVILDEIFGSQDERRRENIIRVLDSLSNTFRQVFIITHIEGIKERVEHIIRVEEMEDGSSRAFLE